MSQVKADWPLDRICLERKQMPVIAATSARARLWTALRGRLRATRAALTARHSLERDLASYHSQSDLDDLYAMLDRYGDRETAQIRRILAARRT
jgi:hypothetical protein